MTSRRARATSSTWDILSHFCCLVASGSSCGVSIEAMQGRLPAGAVPLCKEGQSETNNPHTGLYLFCVPVQLPEGYTKRAKLHQ